MKIEGIDNLGKLKKSGYQSRSIKDELRSNLRHAISEDTNPFEGIWGYEDSVIPELQRAILSRHNINLLGLRGQAKTRLARMMVKLLDEWIPVVEGSEIHDDPLNPISRYAKDIVTEKGDDTSIQWIHRSERYFEKLATPDVSIADLIGDVDPIKAANLKLSYADDRVIHFGMIPRANRSIFVINELPDLQARIQVALFNILQEGDVQIRGFKMRLPLDIQFVFTANPEDYTNRGSIVTPLKDRIGSQILTHYPKDIQTAQKITAHEKNLEDEQLNVVKVPQLASTLLENIAFEARKSEFIDEKSGVSARLSISAYENLISSAELRALQNGLSHTWVRMSDFQGIIPSITGKVELVYEGEQEGAAFVAQNLIGQAIRTQFNELFPKIDKLKRSDTESPYAELLSYFDQGEFKLALSLSDNEYMKTLDSVEPLNSIVEKHHDYIKEHEKAFMLEFVLWALAEFSKLSKESYEDGIQFKDLFDSYLRGTVDLDE